MKHLEMGSWHATRAALALVELYSSAAVLFAIVSQRQLC